jgi:hypothetical protein
VSRAAGAVIARGPVPELRFLLQMFGVGSVIGLTIAHRARSRTLAVDAWLITTRWTLITGFLGAIWLLYEAVS